MSAAPKAKRRTAKHIAEMIAERMSPEPNQFVTMKDIVAKSLKAMQDALQGNSQFYAGSQWPTPLRRNDK
jgi:hypothetical protein